MPKPIFVFDAAFIKSLLGLPKFIHAKLSKSLSKLANEQFDSGLRLKALSGKSKGLHSLRVDDQYRLILARPSENQIRLLAVEKHEDVYADAERMVTSAEIPIAPIPGLTSIQETPIGTTEPMLTSLLSNSKYFPITRFLAEQAQKCASVELTFTQIESLLGTTLPAAALKYSAWWANDRSSKSRQCSAWLVVGWKTTGLNLAGRRITLIRDRSVAELFTR